MKKSLLMVLIVIAVGVFTRLYRIDQPLVDRHNFRQTDTWVISQKLINGKASFFAPRFNHAPDPNNTERYFMAEVPFYESLIGFVYQLSSSLVAVRSINIVLAVLLSGVLFCISKELFNDDLAAFVTAVAIHFFPGFSFWGRAVTPDILSLFGFAFSVLAALKARTRLVWFVPLVLGYSLAVLSKPSYVIFGPLLAWILFKPELAAVFKALSGKLKNKSTENYLILALISLVIPLILLFLWRVWILTFSESVRSDPDFLTLMHGHKGYLVFWKETNWFWQFISERLFGELLTPVGGFLFASGLVLMAQKLKSFIGQTMYPWVGLCVVLTVFLSWGTRTHDYYALPWILPAGMVVGFAFAAMYRGLLRMLQSSALGQFFGSVLILSGVSLGIFFGPYAWWQHMQAYADFGPYVLWEESMQQEYEDLRYLIGEDDKVLTILEEYSPFVLNELDREGTVMELGFFDSCPDWQSVKLRMSDYLRIEPKTYILVDTRQHEDWFCDMAEFIDHFWTRYPVVYEGNTFTVFRVMQPELRVKGQDGLMWLELWNMEPNVQLEVGGLPGREEALIFMPEWKSTGNDRGYVAGPLEVSNWKSFKLYWESPEIVVESPEWAKTQDGWVVKK